jgi:radical SAM superfamily enzyme YgiQ (UPF0313 family)
MLIQPKMNLRPMDTNLKTRMSPALALLTLIALTPKPHDVFIANENLTPINFNDPVDLVAITVTVDVCDRAKQIAKEFQKRGIKVVAGGIHISAVPDEVVDHFDSICIGMAERVWASILDDAQKNALKKIYRDSNNFCGSEIVSPAYHAIDKNQYLFTNIVSTSRGCPFKCDFCYNSCENSIKHVKRPIDAVIKDIESINNRHIMFIDDNFIGDPKWTREFLPRLSTLHIKWNCAVSANIINDLGLLDLMKHAGCQSLFIGFETINKRSLDSVSKRQNNIDKYNYLIDEIHKRGIMINASIVFGLPEDDEEIFDSTLKWLVANKIETVTAHILTPYPGTKLYNKMKAEGLIFDDRLCNYNTAHVVFHHPKISQQQLHAGYIDFYKKFYSFKNIIKRYPSNPTQRVPYLLFNLWYRKFGKLTGAVSSLIPLNRIGRIAEICAYRTR